VLGYTARVSPRPYRRAPRALALALALSACTPASSTRGATDTAADAAAPADIARPADAARSDAASPPRVVTDAPTFLRGAPTDPWWPGDVHVHATGASNDTGGDSTPSEIARVARERGLAFVVLTDHSNSTGSDPGTLDEDLALHNQGPEFPFWDEVALLSVDDEFLMVDGNEVSPVTDEPRVVAPRGHIGCLPRDLSTFDRSGAFVDRPRGEVSGGQALAQALDRGCFAVVNHPYGLAPWIMYDWTSRDYDALEVWNGGNGFDAADLAAWDAWRCDLLQGKATTPIGASDNHRVMRAPPGDVLNPALGSPSTSVRAAALTWPNIMAGLARGDVALHEGESLALLEGHAADGAWTPSGPWAWLHVHGRLDTAAAASTLVVARAEACADPRPATTAPTVQQVVVYTREVAPGEAFDVAVPVDATAAGVYTAALTSPLPAHYAAFSRALVQPSTPEGGTP